MGLSYSQNEYWVIGINIFDFIEKQSLALFYDHARYESFEAKIRFQGTNTFLKG